ncbi:MAG: hypothetical protein NZM65_10200, partial [Flavobacteriales bacterium]|nr:hypothetical protein [Flavobacteriales bacterium]MDW8411044.1 hypothetical protein [Flavobacteriales bacterium]
MIRIYRFFKQRPWALIGFITLFFVTGIWRFSKLRIENDLFAFIDDGQELRDTRRLLAQHPVGRRILVYGKAQPGSELSVEEVASRMERALVSTPENLWERIEVR